MGFQDYFVSPQLSVAEALAKLELCDHKILFVASNGGADGVLTDGDIRRYLLRGGDINAPIGGAAAGKPLCFPGYYEAGARALLAEKTISCIPMTDKNGEIHALVFADETLHRDHAPVNVPVIIMAGGLGTRLYPYTKILPKPLIPVGDRTITEHIINRFKKFGFYDFHMVVNHKKNLIKSYFSEVDCGANIRFIDEDTPLGTGGGLSFFRGQFNTDVIVCYADSVIEADYADLLNCHRGGNDFTMVCAEKKVTVPYGVVEVSADGALTALREKPSFDLLTNTGLYVASVDFINSVPPDTFLPITDHIEQRRAAGKRIGVYTIDENSFIDIGQLEDLRSVENKLR